ncbi:MAG: ABC transporter family substrate-binding protein [Cryobacterium sp.]|nr:ABC transporter family substrate-binding protein [Cryobacterium sp.]
MRTPLVLAVVGILVSGLLTACVADETTIVAGSSVRVASTEPFLSLNDRSRWGNTAANRTIVAAVNSTFASYDEHSELELDESFGAFEVISNNPFIVRYTLADTAHWSDGTPVDATDLLLAWAANSGALNDAEFDPRPFINNETGEWLRATPPGVVWFDGAVSEGLQYVTKTPELSADRRTIDFEFDHFFIDWALVINVGLPAHVVAKRALRVDDPVEAKAAVVAAIADGDRGALATLARAWNTAFTIDQLARDASLRVSNGPYVISDIVEGETVTLTANANYRGSKKPRYETVVVSIVADQVGEIAALEAGTVDVIVPRPGAEVLAELASLPGVTVKHSYSASYAHLDLVMRDSLNGDIENPQVRQAFLHTIPVDALVAASLGEVSDSPTRRLSHTMLPGQAGYEAAISAHEAVTRQKVDIELAESLLAQAGNTSPVVCLLFDPANERRVVEFELIRDSAGRAGIRVTDCASSDWVGLLGTPRSYDAALFSWDQGNLSVAGLRAVYGTGEKVNFSHYSSERVDALLSELEVTRDAASQQRLRASLDRELWTDGYGMPLYQSPVTVAWRDDVSGVMPTPLMRGILWNVWEWNPPTPPGSDPGARPAD